MAIHGTMEPSDWLDVISEKKALFWAGINSVAITEHRLGIFNVAVAGGDLEELQEMFEEMKPYARRIGCTRIQIIGRPGWEKILNMKRESVILSEDLWEKQ